MAEYTPSTEQVRERSAGNTPGEIEDGYAEFDRFLAAYEAEIRERIYKDIKAEESKIRGYVDFDQHQDDCVSQINGLRRAARIARGATR